MYIQNIEMKFLVLVLSKIVISVCEVNSSSRCDPNCEFLNIYSTPLPNTLNIAIKKINK